MHQKVTPVQKVIQLLQGMAEKGKKEKHEEQVQFAAYKQFCDDTTVEKQRAIKEATAKMEQLVAAIQKAEADAATLAKGSPSWTRTSRSTRATRRRPRRCARWRTQTTCRRTRTTPSRSTRSSARLRR